MVNISRAVKHNISVLEDKLTGDSGHLREMYQAAFKDTEAERLMREAKAKNRKMALLLLLMVAAVVFSVVSNVYSKESFSFDLERPVPGSAKTIEAEVSAEYGGYTASERARIRILPKEPTPEEAEVLLKSLEQRLPAAILGANTSLEAVSSDLNLPTSDPETGADISWRSSNARVISNEGKVNLVGSEKGSIVTLTAYIRIANQASTLHIVAVTGDGMPEEKIDAALKARLGETIKEISLSRDGESAVLPEETKDGVKLSWAEPEQENGLAVIFVCALLVFFCYTQRYRTASRYIEKARAEMERDFPDFIQKLGLLLDAGLVITSAIERITGDYLKTSGACRKRRLYEELASALERTHAAGTSLVVEFSELARRSGLREIMRFSATLSDNIDKGSTLSGKLRAENELLWESRKKRVEKEGRIAETRLIFPMALQILAIIAITVMPAFFEMY